MRKSFLALAIILALAGGAIFTIKKYPLRIDSFAPLKEVKTYRIGVLVRGSGYETGVEGYRRKMAQLGYEEGKNVVYDVRFVSAREDLPRAVEEFLESGVDVIHTYSTPATQVAYELTKNTLTPVPIVFGSVGDPVIAGLVRAFERPGTNVTGVVSLSTELTSRRLELLREINPATRRVAMPHTALENGDVAAIKSVTIAKETAQRLGIELVLFPVRTREDNARVAEGIMRRDIDGIIVGGDSLIWGDIDMYIARAIKEKIPFSVFDLSQVKKGALVGFGPDFAISGEQSAVITNQILRGRSPAEIPVEVPRKLILAVNQETARLIGVLFSDEFLRGVNIVVDK